MARTAPIPNIPAIPGMNPGVFVMGGGGGQGGSGGKGGKGKGGKQGGKGKNGGDGANGGGKKGVDGCTKEGEPVDVVSGAVLHERHDFHMQGIWLFEWKSTYLSSAARGDRGYGYGWSHSFAHRLEVRRRSTIWTDEGGIEQDFPALAPGESFRGVLGRELTRHADGSFTLHLADPNIRLDFAPSAADPLICLLRSVRDAFGNAIRLTYQDDHLVEIVDTVGRTFRIRYGQYNRIASVETKRDPAGGDWVAFARYEYDDAGDQVAFYDVLGNACRYRYDDHRLVEWTDRLGLVVHYVYENDSPDARCVETWTDRRDRRDVCLAPGLPATMASPNGPVPIKGMFHRILVYGDDVTEAYDTRSGVTVYEHGPLGTTSKEVGPSGDVVTRELDERGRVVAETDALEATTTFEWDERDRLVAEVDALGRETRRVFGDFDVPDELHAPSGAVFRYIRDARGLATSVLDSAGTTNEYQYDERGLLVRSARSESSPYVVRRHWNGQAASIEDDRGRTEFEYDGWGRATRARRRDGTEILYQWDDAGRLIARRGTAGDWTRMEYDAHGNLITVFAPDGTVRRGVYGGFDWITAVQDAAGRLKHLFYDWDGEIVQVVDERGDVHHFDYDRGGRLVRERHPDGRTIEYRHDVGGRVVSRIDNDGSVTKFDWDAVGNLVEQVWADGSTDRYAYDALDFMVVAETDGIRVDMERDAMGRLRRETSTLAPAHAIESSFSPGGFRTSRKVGARAVAYERDPRGRVVARVYDGQRRQEMRFDTMGSVIGFAYGGGLRVDFTWDSESRFASQTWSSPRGGRVIAEGLTEAAGRRPVIDRSYEYTAHCEIAAVRDRLLGDTTYDYDAVGQLLERRTPTDRETFVTDITGNVAPSTSSVLREVGDRVVAVGPVSYAYDARGRVIRRTLTGPGVPPRTWTYEWTAAGQIASARCPDGKVVRYLYDALGRRVRKRGSDGSETTFVWEGDSLACEIQRSPSGEERVRTFLFDENDAFRPVAQHEDGAWFDVATTPIGTPTELIDETGEVAWSLETRAFGAPLREVRTRASSPLRFPGQLYDEDLGIHYNRFRDYDPEAGRFLSPDPTETDGGLNAYAYARNPIGWTDPLGQADGDKLNAAMKADGQPGCPPNHQTHHVIPEQLYDDKELADLFKGEPGKPLKDSKGKLNDPHHPDNGIHLPQSKQQAVANGQKGGPKTVHKGGHAGYTRAVKEKLLAKKKAAEAIHGKPLPPCKKAQILADTQDELKQQLQDGTFTHTNSKGKTVKGLNRFGVAP